MGKFSPLEKEVIMAAPIGGPVFFTDFISEYVWATDSGEWRCYDKLTGINTISSSKVDKVAPSSTKEAGVMMLSTGNTTASEMNTLYCGARSIGDFRLSSSTDSQPLTFIAKVKAINAGSYNRYWFGLVNNVTEMADSSDSPGFIGFTNYIVDNSYVPDLLSSSYWKYTIGNGTPEAACFEEDRFLITEWHQLGFDISIFNGSTTITFFKIYNDKSNITYKQKLAVFSSDFIESGSGYKIVFGVKNYIITTNPSEMHIDYVSVGGRAGR